MSPRGAAVRRAGYRTAFVAALILVASACEQRDRWISDAPAAEASGSFAYTSGQPALDRLQPLIREALASNRRTFAGVTGPVAGFGAGAIYPQIWLRDSATLVQVTRYLYPRRHLTSWIEEHLAHQRQDGSLYDWIAAGAPAQFRANAPGVIEVYRGRRLTLSADRNSAASDQESSAVLAAAQVFSITGDRRWLMRRIAGRPLLERLDAALQFVVDHRIDRGTGLVTAAFTADWGDVGPVRPGQRAIYRDASTPIVAGLYASAMFAGASERLSGMYRAVEDGRRAGLWHLRARRMIEAIDATLWQDDRGFYRMNQLLHAPPHWRAPGSDGTFALGGNAVALLHRVADDPKVTRVLAAAAALRTEFGMPTISGVLLPPFPAGTFRHPMLRQPFEYQNGGQWDWWGGRLLLAAFERGHAEMARAELARIADQIDRMGGLYEWSTPAGQGRGSAAYAGAGGVLGGAILRGLYGIDLRGDGLDLHVRLGAESGRVSVEEPASGASVAYDYRYAADEARAVLQYESSAPGTGTLALLLPPGFEGATGRLDGGPERDLATHVVGRDRYAALSTDWRPHRLEIAFR